jgi:deoxyribose-phosphate aldolase
VTTVREALGDTSAKVATVVNLPDGASALFDELAAVLAAAP